MSASATLPSQIVTTGNTQAITVEGLQDAIGGGFLNAANLVATLYDLNGNAVPGCVNITLTYTPGSNGEYRGLFGDDTFEPNLGSGYSLVVTGSQNGGFIKIVMKVEVRDRSF